MQDMLGVCEWVMEKARKLFHSAIVYAQALDTFKSVPGVTQGGDPGASDQIFRLNFLFALYY